LTAGAAPGELVHTTKPKLSRIPRMMNCKTNQKTALNAKRITKSTNPRSYTLYSI